VSEGVVIRRATVDDIEGMLPLRLAMQREFRKSGQAAAGAADPEGLLAANRSFYERKLPTGEFVAFVAAAEGKIVATSGTVVYEAPPTPGNPTGEAADERGGPESLPGNGVR
jgi:hypothetical protein